VAKPADETFHGFSAPEALELHCIQELMRACEERNVSAFRAAIEALTLNLFDSIEEQPEKESAHAAV
jgi:hypothetical protein